MSEEFEHNLPGLYLHIPFCKTKCPYCDFYSITSPELIAAYLGALDKEARIYTGRFENRPYKAGDHNPLSFLPFDSLYLGGGTPSLLDGPQLTRLVTSLRRHFDFAPDTEFTLEANPDDVTLENLHLWRDLGVNRLSLGAQSFNEKELIFLQRRHTAWQTLRAIELIQAAGIDNLGLDLMYGLPGQSLADWTKTLETALGCAPEHLSCYQLTIAAGGTSALRTPFARRLAAGELDLPEEEVQREFFLLTHQFLEDQGYVHYEVSNFARGEVQAGSLRHHECRHNRKYWDHTPYLGLGPAAHSYRDGRRWWNLASMAQYGAAMNAGQAAMAGSETLTPEQLRLEALCLGFRSREGVALKVIRQYPRWQVVLEELQEAGLVRLVEDRVAATPEGLVVADRLPLLFLD